MICLWELHLEISQIAYCPNYRWSITLEKYLSAYRYTLNIIPRNGTRNNLHFFSDTSQIKSRCINNSVIIRFSLKPRKQPISREKTLHTTSKHCWQQSNPFPPFPRTFLLCHRIRHSANIVCVNGIRSIQEADYLFYILHFLFRYCQC